MSEHAWQTLLADYPALIEIPVAWGEMDALGHVNNIVYLRYFESARIVYFEALGMLETMASTGIGPILAETRCRYKLPLTYPDTVVVGARIAELAADRFLMHYRLVSRHHGKVAAEGDGRVVAYNFKTKAKAAFPESIVARIRELDSAALVEAF